LSKAELFHTSRKPGFEIDGSQDLGHFLGNSTSNNTGLNNLYEQDNDSSIHDAFQFTPCGYSSNTILNGESYYTLHVTPEKDWSYASFESNVNSLDFNLHNLEILNKVINVFKPGKFQLNFFTNKFEQKNYLNLMNLSSFGKYKKIDKIVYDLHDYQLLYISFQLNEDELINDLQI
jgi:S-adenosylmethionine decarboxylase